MSKYLKNDNIAIDEYILYLGAKNNKSKNELIKEIKGDISKRYLLCNKIKKIFGNVYISNEVLDTLDDIFDLEDMDSLIIKEELTKAYPLAIAYPELSSFFIKELLPFYNARMFEELDLFHSLDMAIETKKDEDFEKIINKCIVAKIKYDDKWISESFILDIYKGEYGDKYIEYLKEIAIKNYIDFSNIILSMPSSSLVSKDEKLVSNINDIYRTEITPLSYNITISYALHEDMDKYGTLYYDTPDEMIMASFTLDDYLNEIKRNTKTLIK